MSGFEFADNDLRLLQLKKISFSFKHIAYIRPKLMFFNKTLNLNRYQLKSNCLNKKVCEVIFKFKLSNILIILYSCYHIKILKYLNIKFMSV